MGSRLEIFKFIIIISGAFLAAGCVTIYNPATQKRETLLIDTQSEVALGKDMDRQIRRRMKISGNLYMGQRLQRIAQRIAQASDRQDLEYHFAIVDDKDLNAFAIPGGFIYVNTGLMNTAGDDELACVLAHEIGHVAARHSVKKMQAVMGYQLIMNIALGLGGNQQAYRAVDTMFDILSLGYSRQDETLADKLAVKYAKRAGFNPYGMITFFKKLQAEAQKKGGILPIEIFSSHPDIETRIKNVENEIAQTIVP